MTSANTFWAPICGLATRVRFWSRASINDGSHQWITDWSQLFASPIDGYLEVGEGPYPVHQVEWVQLSPMKLKGGLAGRPLEFADISHEIVAHLRQHELNFEIRNELWSMNRLFENQPVQAIHVPNPNRS